MNRRLKGAARYVVAGKEDILTTLSCEGRTTSTDGGAAGPFTRASVAHPGAIPTRP
jgi:hypothetical protein